MRKRTFTLAGAALLSCIASAAHAQNHVRELLDFQSANPGAKPFYVEGRMTRVYGQAFSTGANPADSAGAFLAEHGDMFVRSAGDILPLAWDEQGSNEVGLMRNHDTGLDKFTLLLFGQQVGGVPVFRGNIRLLVRNEDGFPLVLASVGLRELAGYNPGAGVANGGEVQTTARMRRNARGLLDVEGGEQVGPARHVIWAGVEGLNVQPRLAVEFIMEAGTPFTAPNYAKRLVLADAETSEILYSESMIHEVDITGTTSGQATDGDGADICHPEVGMRLPYVQVSVQGGNTVFADANGDFVVPHAGNTQVNVTASLQAGRYFNVFNQDGSNGEVTLTSPVTPPGPANFTFNSANSSEFSRANVNAYLHANVIRDLVLFHFPNYPGIANQLGFDVNTNINSSCNAFYNGSSINFYRAAGGCSNTANESVVYHEYGHHLVASGGSGQGQYGEGMGDSVGVVIQDQPILAYGFQNNCSAGIRNASNNLQYPCTGAIHTCGQLISGCIWETRNELVITEPQDYLSIIQALTYNSIPLHQGDTIAPDITIDFLTLDDDNGNIGDGTPHYNEIATGFGEHNMDAPPLDLLDFNYPSGRPDIISPSGGVAFVVEVIGVAGDPEPGTGLLHVDSGSGFQAFPMNEISDNVYEANFPATACGTSLRYYVSAETTTNTVATDPQGAPAAFYSAVSATGGNVVFADTYNTDQGWTVVNEGLTDGAWQRATPHGAGDRGDPTSDANDSGTLCFVTDNATGNSDVDGGPTRLVSPVLDLSTGSSHVFSYQWWFTNDDQDIDRLTVQISNNGGTTWTQVASYQGDPLASGQWRTATFVFEDFLPGTNNVRIRFNATDNPNDSVTEAGIDDFRVSSLECGAGETELTAFQVVTGTLVSGNLDSLRESDDVRMRVRSGLGSTLTDLHKMELVVDAATTVGSPSTVDLTIESRVNQPGATGRVLARDWTTGNMVQVGSFPVGQNEAATSINGLDASRYVNANGEIELMYRTVIIVPFLAFSYDTFVDQIDVTVN
jgi:hypothetical protein